MLPIVIIASPLPVQPPTAVPLQVAAVLPNTLRRAAVAYDAPAGNVLGAIEQGRVYQVLARFGADWLQLMLSVAVWCGCAAPMCSTYPPIWLISNPHPRRPSCTSL
jgi:hypothetical protein